MSPAPVLRLRGRDAEFQRAQTLKTNRTKRRRSRVGFVEGVMPVNAVLRGGHGVESVWYAHDRPLSRWARGVIDAAQERVVELPGALLDELSDRESGVELIVLAHLPVRPALMVATAPGAPVVVLDRPASPRNIGAVARSAAAFGAAALCIAGHAADPFDPRAIAASRGAVFTLPVAEIAGATDLLAWRDRRRERGEVDAITGLVAGVESQPLGRATLGDCGFLVLGTESIGLSAAMTQLCETLVHIEMDDTQVDSLNLAVAAGIALQAAYAQRRSVVE